MARDDAYFMSLALREARRAGEADEVPVGAVVVGPDGKVLARGRNRIRRRRDPTAHAEVLALRAAARRLQCERLRGTILYTTLEPCALCAGALSLARVARVVFAAFDPKAGAAGSVVDLLKHRALNHHPAVQGGVMGTESADILRAFFKGKRFRR
jgi:tRNA(adenine34) deaminase